MALHPRLLVTLALLLFATLSYSQDDSEFPTGMWNSRELIRLDPTKLKTVYMAERPQLTDLYRYQVGSFQELSDVFFEMMTTFDKNDFALVDHRTFEMLAQLEMQEGRQSGTLHHAGKEYRVLEQGGNFVVYDGDRILCSESSRDRFENGTDKFGRVASGLMRKFLVTQGYDGVVAGRYPLFFSFQLLLDQRQDMKHFLSLLSSNSLKKYQTPEGEQTILEMTNDVEVLFPHPEPIQTTAKHQLMQESGLDPLAVSSANAKGVTQWIDGYTAQMQIMYGDILFAKTGDREIDPFNPYHQILIKTAYTYDRYFAIKDLQLGPLTARNADFVFQYGLNNSYYRDALAVDPSLVIDEQIRSSFHAYDVYNHVMLKQFSKYWGRNDAQEDMFIDCILKWGYIRGDGAIRDFLKRAGTKRHNYDFHDDSMTMSVLLRIAMDYRESGNDRNWGKYTTLYPFWISGAYRDVYVIDKGQLYIRE